MRVEGCPGRTVQPHEAERVGVGMPRQPMGQLQIAPGPPASVHESVLPPTLGVEARVLPQSAALELGREIARVDLPRLAGRSQGSNEARLRDGKEGAEQPQAGNLPHHGDPGSAGRPRAAGDPHRHRLGLVLTLMAQQQMKDTGRPACPLEQPVACRSGRGLDTGDGLGAIPMQDAGLDADRGKPPCDLRRFHCGFRPKPVVHDQRQEIAAACASPICRQQRQRCTVGSAGNGRRQSHLRLERTQGLQQGREFGRAQRLRDISCSRRRTSHGSGLGGSAPGRWGVAWSAPRTSGRPGRGPPWRPATCRA